MITNLFLKAKHWHLFLLSFVLPFGVQFILMGVMMSSMLSQSNPDPSFIMGYFKFFPFIFFLFVVVLWGWIWSMAVGLQSKVPPHVKMKVTKFQVFFIIPVVYIFLFLFFITTSVSGLASSGAELSVGVFGAIFALVVPLHLFSMFCIFYTLYFAAKTVKTVELQREVTFSDFAGEFFLIWFYPVGVWIIQPKVNKMIEG